MKFGDEDELLSTIEVDPSSTSQNFFTALRLLLQAFRTVPVFTYISFALSLVFLLLYLNPVSFIVAQATSTTSKPASRAHSGAASKGKRMVKSSSMPTATASTGASKPSR